MAEQMTSERAATQEPFRISAEETAQFWSAVKDLGAAGAVAGLQEMATAGPGDDGENVADEHEDDWEGW